MSWLRREAVSNHGIVQLPNGKKWLRCKVGYIQCFIADSGTLGCSEPESAGCHLVSVERFFLRPKNKMAAACPYRLAWNRHNFLNNGHRKLILVSISMFSWSRNSIIHSDFTWLPYKGMKLNIKMNYVATNDGPTTDLSQNNRYIHHY